MILLLFSAAAPASAQQITSEIIEAIIVHLDQEGAESQVRVDSLWAAHGVRPPDHTETVFVLSRENLEETAGMSLRDVEALMRALHAHGVPARWCQRPCRTVPGDETVTLKWALPVRPHRLLIETEVHGRHPRDEFDTRMDAWMSRVNFHLIRTDSTWRVTHSSRGYHADLTTIP